MKSPVTQITLRELIMSDLPQVVRVHLSAFPDSALTKLGIETVRRYYDWLMKGPHEAYYLACEYGDGLAGYCFGGRFNGALSGFLRRNRFFLVWTVLTHPWLIAQSSVAGHSRQALNILYTQIRSPKPSGVNVANPVRQGSFAILSIAVHSQFHGRGLGKALIREAESIAQQKGFKKMHLSVHQTNLQAIRFYEGQGWRKEIDENGWQGIMTKQISG